MAGYPCGHPAKNFGQALQILEKQAFRNRYPARTSIKNFGLKNFGLIFPFPTFWGSLVITVRGSRTRNRRSQGVVRSKCTKVLTYFAKGSTADPLRRPLRCPLRRPLRRPLPLPPPCQAPFQEDLTGRLRWGDGLTGVLVGVSVGVLVGTLSGRLSVSAVESLPTYSGKGDEPEKVSPYNRERPWLSGTESAFRIENRAIQNRCDSNRAIPRSLSALIACDSDGNSESIFRDSTAIRLHFLLLAAEILAFPGPRFWESCDSRFAILCR